MAIAKNRGWALASDDRPATSLAGQIGVPVVTTAELLKEWGNANNAKKAQITAALLNIQRFAKSVPRQNSPEADWWFLHTREK
jgi:hypothetical protein